MIARGVNGVVESTVHPNQLGDGFLRKVVVKPLECRFQLLRLQGLSRGGAACGIDGFGNGVHFRVADKPAQFLNSLKAVSRSNAQNVFEVVRTKIARTFLEDCQGIRAVLREVAQDSQQIQWFPGTVQGDVIGVDCPGVA